MILTKRHFSSSYNINFTNETDTILMRIVSDTDVNDSLVASEMPIVPSDIICGLFRIGGQFDNSSPFTVDIKVSQCAGQI
jgi:hypothetical protein